MMDKPPGEMRHSANSVRSATFLQGNSARRISSRNEERSPLKRTVASMGFKP